MDTTADQRSPLAMNGHARFAPSGPDAILYQHAESLGEIRVELRTIHRRLDEQARDIQDLRTRSMLGLTPMHWVQIGIGITVLGAAITGRISWGESLPVIGRMFGG